MYLLINMSQQDQIDLSLFTKDVRYDATFQGRNKELLASIDTMLSTDLGDESVSVHVDKEDLKGIMVVVGEGGFTSTRLAVTVANTFGYVLQIPLMTITSDQVQSAQELIPELEKKPKGQYISATYSGEPNIGK